jgi:hypothetical protein
MITRRPPAPVTSSGLRLTVHSWIIRGGSRNAHPCLRTIWSFAWAR